MRGRAAGRTPVDRPGPVIVSGCPLGMKDANVTVTVLDGLTAMDTREEGGGRALSSP